MGVVGKTLLGQSPSQVTSAAPQTQPCHSPATTPPATLSSLRAVSCPVKWAPVTACLALGTPGTHRAKAWFSLQSAYCRSLSLQSEAALQSGPHPSTHPQSESPELRVLTRALWAVGHHPMGRSALSLRLHPTSLHQVPFKQRTLPVVYLHCLWLWSGQAGSRHGDT